MAIQGWKPMPTKPLNKILLAGICLAFLGFNSGCSILNRFKGPGNEAPIVMAKESSLPEVINFLNRQNQKVQQLKTDVQISVDGIPKLRGDLVIERPEKLRLTAGLLGMSELGFDLGSNDELFWIWKKAATPGDPPALYFARHLDYQSSAVKRELQLQPKWLLEGLGLIEFNGSETEPKLRPDGILEVVTRAQSPDEPAIRVTLIDAQHGLVLQQGFYDANGNRLAYINSSKYRYYPDQDVSLPQQIDVHIYDSHGAESRMLVTANEYTINALYGDPERLWTMPNPPDVPKIDLTAVGQQIVEMESAPHISENWSTFPTKKY